jgi:predicted Zn-dependent peptidase
LRHAFAQLRGQLAISAQNQENSALALAKSVLYRGYAPEWQETMREIEHTSSEKLQKIAQDCFAPTNAYILTYK